MLCRPRGRPSRKPLVRYKSFRYQAKSWTRPGRIVAKVEHHRGELLRRVGFIVTNMVSRVAQSYGSTTSAARRSDGSK